MHSAKKIVFVLAALFLTATGYSQDASTNKWEKSAAIGLTLNKGNTDNILFTADVLATRKWISDELSLGASGSYGEDDGEKNNETVKGFAQWNHLLTDRFYTYVRA